MSTSIYHIHRSIGRPASFRGIKGSYIVLAAAVILLSFLFLIGLYCIGVPMGLDLPLTIAPGATALFILRRLSHKYGPQGLMKYSASRRLPRELRYRSRTIFLKLKTKHNDPKNK